MGRNLSKYGNLQEYAVICGNMLESVGFVEIYPLFWIWRNVLRYHNFSDFFCLCRKLSAYVEPCRTTWVFVWICLNMAYFVEICPTLSECQTVSSLVVLYCNISNVLGICRILSDYIGLWLKMSDYVWTCRNMSAFVHYVGYSANLGISECISISLSASLLIFNLLTWAEVVLTCAHQHY